MQYVWFVFWLLIGLITQRNSTDSLTNKIKGKELIPNWFVQKWHLLELNWRASQGQDILGESQDGELEAPSSHFLWRKKKKNPKQ